MPNIIGYVALEYQIDILMIL